MLGLDTETIYQAIGQALHLTTATRQSRKGEISSWKAYAPALAGKVAVEAVDRAMRGEGAPVADLGRRGRRHRLAARRTRHGVRMCRCPARARPSARSWTATPRSTRPSTRARRRSTWPAGCASAIGDLDQIASIVLHTSHHTHVVIGTGSGDPQKFDPNASRETLDHSVMYIFAVALQDGTWHHERSYAPERAQRPDTIELWHKISTVEDPEWTRRYHSTDPAEKAFGARAEVTLKSGEVIVDELAVADAHPLGARPFAREQYIAKFRTLADGVIDAAEQDRFLDAAAAHRRARGRRARSAHLPVSATCSHAAPDGRRRGSSDERPHRGIDVRSRQARSPSVPGWTSGQIQRLPGAFSPLVAKLVQEIGFEGVYVSGAVLSAGLGLPDIGLTTLTEVAARGQQIARGHRSADARSTPTPDSASR